MITISVVSAIHSIFPNIMHRGLFQIPGVLVYIYVTSFNIEWDE